MQHVKYTFIVVCLLTSLPTAGTAAVFPVITLADSGPGSLRQAFLDANDTVGPDEIVCDAALSGTIELASPLPALTETAILQGSGAAQLTVDANRLGRVLTLSAPVGSAFVVGGLTLRGGMSNADGGGISLSGGQSLTLEDVRLIDNIAGNYSHYSTGGGLITSTSTDVVIRDSLIADNVASHGGGVGMYGGNLSVERSAIVGNLAEKQGGGLWLAGGTFVLGETTVAHNVAEADDPIASYGGAIMVANGAQLGMYQCTIVNNWAKGYPGLAALGGTVTEVAATIIAGNRFVTTGDENNCFGNLGITDRYNLSGDASCGFTGASDLENVDPELNSLAWAGGPTPSVVPTSASPVLDTGSNLYCLDEDQRGWSRPVDGDGAGDAVCDVGATEYTPGAEKLIFARDFEWMNPLERWSAAVGSP